MVSKTMKNHRYNRRRRLTKSPVKEIATRASVVVASINKSIYTCHHRLIKIFTKLARITTTPTKKSSLKKGYQVLTKIPADHHLAAVRRSLFLSDETPTPPLPLPLPPSIYPERRTVFLDLDETLVHSRPGTIIPPAAGSFDFIVKPVIDGERVEFYVLKRPFVNEFLEILSKRFEIVVFTAGIEAYASLVLDRLDWKGLISHRLYRSSCKEVDGKYVKDLSEVGRDLKRAVIVDDNPNSYGLQRENAVPIKPFMDDLGDDELRKLVKFFEECDEFDDMRDAVKRFFGGGGGGEVEIGSSEKLIAMNSTI